jgi:hypothetical protein
MGQTLSNFDAMLKEFYPRDVVMDLVKQKAPFYFEFKKSKRIAADGRRVIQPVHYGRNTGTSALGEGGLLPTAGYQKYVDLTIPYRYVYGRVDISGPVMKQTRTSQGAFDDVMETEIEGAIKDGARDLSRQIQGFGRGDLCQISGTGASATRDLVNGQGVADNDDIPARHLAAGMIVAGITPSTGAFEFVRTVDSVGSDLKSVVFTATVTPSEDLTRLVRCGSASATALADTGYSREIMGLLGMVDDSTYVADYFGTTTRSSYSGLSSTRIDLGAGNLSLDIMHRAFHAVDQASDGKIGMLVANQITAREYYGLLQVMKRYVDSAALSPDGGLKRRADNQGYAIEFNQVPVREDRDVPLGIMYGLDMDSFRRYSIVEGEWADDDGRILLRNATTDSYEGRLRVIFGNAACLAPNRNFVISSIKLNTGIDVINVF